VIILPSWYIKNLFQVLFNKDSTYLSAAITSVFDSDVYDAETIASIQDFFTQSKVSVKSGYPVGEDVISPSIYIVQGDFNASQDSITGELDTSIDEDDSTGTGTLYRINQKQVRMICLSTSVQITEVLALLVENFLYQYRNDFNAKCMQNMIVSMPEYELLNKFLPQSFFSKSIMATFHVTDTFNEIATNPLIQRITLDEIKSIE
jgi:hypothetical protein